MGWPVYCWMRGETDVLCGFSGAQLRVGVCQPGCGTVGRLATRRDRYKRLRARGQQVTLGGQADGFSVGQLRVGFFSEGVGCTVWGVRCGVWGAGCRVKGVGVVDVIE